MKAKSVFFLFFTLGLVQLAISQNKKTMAEAEKRFSIRDYEQALPLFLEVIQAGEKDPMIHYKTAVCYQKSIDINQQLKAIPFLEFSLQNGTLPVNVYAELGELYLKDENLQKAIETFSLYKEKTTGDKTAQAKANQFLATCNTAVALMSVPRNTKVNNFGGIINTSYTEYNPVVSADETVMAFTAFRPNTGKTRSGDKFIEEILISNNHSGTWSEPKVVSVASEYNVGTAGISADGQKMLIFMGGVSDPGNLFEINRSGDSWSKPSLITPTINNSRFLESTASITPDGKTIYFASDRSGGQGGLDIYRTSLQGNGQWSNPVNLGPEINTKANEDAPFIHPDQKTLFFTTDGRNSMGGRDIFVSKLVKDKWSTP
ncbi:MAG TPA: hypothetical protein VD927_16735, partial [Chryseosolibacter sp.]|nr:hypothetical protein [Chryseosolibacter sp.]